jgi:hypothetical protein
MLALDWNDLPYVALDNGSSLTVMRYNGSAWSAVGSSVTYGGDFLFALDSNNSPYLAYGSSDAYGGVTVKKYNGASWTTVGSAQFISPSQPQREAYLQSLVLDSQNLLYVGIRYQGEYANPIGTLMKTTDLQDQPQAVPSLVPSANGAAGSPIAVDQASAHTCVLMSGGTVQCW